MMKDKKSKVLIGCLALLLVMAVGYALFSETITINGTATAKGDFDITLTCVPGTLDGIDYKAKANGTNKDNNYANDSCVVNDNEVTYNTELLQPGASRNFVVKVTNTGSIPATWDINDETTKSSCKGNYETGTFEECVDGAIAGNDLNIGLDVVAFNDGTNIYKILLSEEIDKFFNDDGSKVVLQPGHSVYVIYTAEWDINGIGGDSGESKDGTLFKEKMTSKFTFEQVTAD